MSADFVNERGDIIIPDPPIAQALFNSTRFAWIWLIIRIYLAWTWIPSGFGKITNPAWMSGGTALRGFWENAVAVPDAGRPQITFDWYRTFLEFMLANEWYTWFGPLVAIAELTIGILLLLGAFTGIAAVLGGAMNFNFMLAGVASVNPVFFLLEVLLIMAWKVAGWYGLDRWLLPRLGTPWSRPAVPAESRSSPRAAPAEQEPG